MKRKLVFMFLFLIMFPAFALIGCSESPATYSILAYSSSYSHGSTMGSASYTEGSYVTLTASTTNSSVLGWIYQNSLILSNNGTYNISNTVENGKVVKSTLSFTCSAATQGNYTALFDEADLNYTRFSGVMLSKQENTTPVGELPQDAESLPNTNLDIYQGSDLIFSQENLLFKQQTDGDTTSALKISTNETKNAVWLTRPQQLYATMRFDNSNFTFRANFSYKQSSTWSAEQNGVSYKVDYVDKEYHIVFRFTKSEQEYYLTFFFDNFKQNI